MPSTPYQILEKSVFRQKYLTKLICEEIGLYFQEDQYLKTQDLEEMEQWICDNY